MLLAGVYLRANEFDGADREVALAIKAWPGNSLSVFLTGEVMMMNGDYEKAAVSLENAAAGTDREWLAAMVAARAREIRDRKEETPRLFTDKAFLREVLLRFILEEAKKSEAARKLNSMIEAAGGLGERVIRGLRPGDGEEEGRAEVHQPAR